MRKSASKVPTVLILGALLACQRQAASPFYDLIENLSVAEVGDGLPAPRAMGEKLFLPFESRVSYYLRLFPGSTLAVERWGGRGRGELRVTIEYRDGRIETVEREVVREDGIVLELPSPREEIVRLSLEAVGSSTEDGTAGLLLTRPVLVSRHRSEPNDAPARSRRADRLPNVVIYLIDTLRADHLGCYGYPLPVSPNIDAFAASATLFESSLAQSAWTRPSVASILTGLSPETHGANDRNDTLAPEALTLAEILNASGYRTGAFVTNGNVAPAFGLGQGFETFRLLDRRASAAARVLQTAVTWLEEEKDGRPFFLYLHTSEPHVPYRPRQPFRAQFAASVPPEIGARSSMKRLGTREVPVTKELAEGLIALYDAEIATNDATFGELVDLLQRRDLYDETVLVLLSDHGEEFYEHGRWEHGKTLYSEILNVPLILRFPGLGQGRRIAEPVQHTDLLPTLLDYLGLPLPSSAEGRSLLPLLEEEGPNLKREIYSHLDLDGRKAIALVADGWKTILPLSARFGRQPELYDQQDRREQRSQAREEPILTGYMVALLRARQLRAAEGALKPGEVVLDPELKEHLRALGYVE